MRLNLDLRVFYLQIESEFAQKICPFPKFKFALSMFSFLSFFSGIQLRVLKNVQRARSTFSSSALFEYSHFTNYGILS